MDLQLIIEDAVANPIKFTLDSMPTNERANFDQRRYAQTKNATVDEGKTYNQKFENADAIRIQFFSNFPQNRVKIVDCEDNQYGPDMFPSIAVEYRNKFYRSSAKFSSIDNKLFVYFSDTVLYLDEAFTVTGPLLAMDGRLPNINAVPGDAVRYSMDGGVSFQSSVISETRWNPTLQAEGYLLEVDASLLDPVDGLVEVSYDEKPANLYTQLISLAGLDAGKYFIRREHGVSAYDVSFTSEPLDVADSHPETLALEYRHEGTYQKADLWNYVYLFDWKNLVRIPADFYKFTPSGELDVDVNDNGTPRLLRARPFRQIEISFLNMPSWLADKVQMALSHDTKIVNGYEHEIENFGQFEMIDRLDLGTYTVALRQKNDRTKKVDNFAYALTAAFVPPAHIDIPFGGATRVSMFETNSGAAFHFLSLPPWLTCDRETFINGDTLVFTIAANATLFNRSETLLAVTDTIDGLTASVTLSQLFDNTPPPQFLEVDRDELLFSYNDADIEIVNVNSSGDYDISQTGYPFTAEKWPGDITRVRIFPSTENPGPGNRVGTVRLTLQANPAIFKDIVVLQTPSPANLLVSVSPTELNVMAGGGNRNVTVTTLTTDTQWQAVSSQPWVTVNTSIQTGSKTFVIFTAKVPIDTPTPRSAVVTFRCVTNPLERTLSVSIEQG